MASLLLHCCCARHVHATCSNACLSSSASGPSASATAAALGAQHTEGDDQQQQQQQGTLRADIDASILSLVEALAHRLPSMSLVQLSRLSRTLETRPRSSSASSDSSSLVVGGGDSGSGGGTSVGVAAAVLPGWQARLLQEVKAAMASQA